LEPSLVFFFKKLGLVPKTQFLEKKKEKEIRYFLFFFFFKDNKNKKQK